MNNIDEQPGGGIEGLWQKIKTAQTGRYFLFKWVLIAAACRLLVLPVNFAIATTPIPTRVKGIGYIYLVQGLIAGALQGWVLFGGSWRIPTWALVAASPALLLTFSTYWQNLYWASGF